MNITSRNLNRIINGYTTSISFKYIEEFCKYLNCSPGELIEIINEKKNFKCDPDTGHDTGAVMRMWAEWGQSDRTDRDTDCEGTEL